MKTIFTMAAGGVATLGGGWLLKLFAQHGWGVALAWLHPDWQKIIRHAWSVRFMGLAALLSGLEVALPAVQPYVAINPLYISVAIGLSASAGFLTRIMAQKEFEQTSHGA